MDARRLRWAAAACAGLSVVLLLVAVVLNDQALSAEEFLPSDDAFGAYALGILLALMACLIAMRSARRAKGGTATLEIILSAVAATVAVLGALLALSEPGIYNAGYQCLGVSEVRLFVAMKPSPATCGYVIPPSDDSLFHPAAFASFAAAALSGTAAILVFAGRTRRAT